MGVLSEEVLTLRTATIDDLDDLADIACAAFPMDPQWVYRFPHRKEYPEDHWICTRLRYKNMIGRDDTAINVITIPTKKDEETIHRPIALAVWELPGGEAGIIFPSDGIEGRRDADPKRMNAFTETTSKAKKDWFEDVYGSERLHLRLLATQPDYQKRGAGTQHCEWGMKLAEERKVPITLFSSNPPAQDLYSHLGFNLLATLIVQIEGEEEKLSTGVMINKKFC